MSKRISQDLYDEVVLENIQTFEMTSEEAITDANEQFKTQDINLAEIVRDPSLYSSEGVRRHPVLIALDAISSCEAVEAADISDDFADYCRRLVEQCAVDVSIRCLAGKSNAMPILLKNLRYDSRTQICLEALIAVCSGNPDILTKEGADEALALLCEVGRQRIQTLAMQFIRVNCILQETNRVMFVEKGLINLLQGIISDCEDTPSVFTEACQVLCTLTLDDDIRVPFGKGSQNVVTIVGNGNIFKKLIQMCQKYESDEVTLAILYRTMACLVTKNEYCYLVMKNGGLKHLFIAMQLHKENINLMKQCLLFLKVVAGNDDVKLAIADYGLLHCIVEIMSRFAIEPSITKNGSAAIAACVLRQTTVSDVVMRDTDFPAVVTRALSIHTTKPKVLMQSCIAIRNLVSRSDEHRSSFLELSAESLLRKAAAVDETVSEPAMAALRDLGCEVTLNEKWKGEGHQIEQ